MGFKKLMVLLSFFLFVLFVVAVLWLMDRGMSEPEALIRAVTWFLTGELTLAAMLAVFEKEKDTNENACAGTDEGESAE